MDTDTCTVDPDVTLSPGDLGLLAGMIREALAETVVEILPEMVADVAMIVLARLKGGGDQGSGGLAAIPAFGCIPPNQKAAAVACFGRALSRAAAPSAPASR